MFASELKIGAVVLKNGQYWKISESNQHKGSAKTGSMVHAKMKNMETGAILEQRYSPDEKVGLIELTEKKMQYLYPEGDQLVFMDLETYSQVAISRKAVGMTANYLKEEMMITVQFHEERPIGVVFPALVEFRVGRTGPSLKGQGSDAVYKPATLENGVEISVPQFIEAGDIIRIEVETGKYIDRIKK